jgi:transposase
MRSIALDVHRDFCDADFLPAV